MVRRYGVPICAIEPSRTAALAYPLAEFPRNFRGELGIRLLAHHLQGLLDLLIGDNAQERRLFQLHGKPLPQRAVENRSRRSCL